MGGGTRFTRLMASLGRESRDDRAPTRVAQKTSRGYLTGKLPPLSEAPCFLPDIYQYIKAPDPLRSLMGQVRAGR